MPVQVTASVVPNVINVNRGRARFFLEPQTGLKTPGLDDLPETHTGPFTKTMSGCPIVPVAAAVAVTAYFMDGFYG
jgi:hypothetical protein